MRLAWHEFFREWDIVLCPIAAHVAFEHQHGAYRGRKLRIDGVELPYFQQLFWAGLATCCYSAGDRVPDRPGNAGLADRPAGDRRRLWRSATIEFARLVTERSAASSRRQATEYA